MFGGFTLPPPTPLNFDAQNRTIRPIDMRDVIGNETIRWMRAEA